MLLKFFLLLSIGSLCNSIIVNNFIINNVDDTLNSVCVNTNNYLVSENDLIESMKFINFISNIQKQNYCNNMMPDVIGQLFSEFENYGVNYHKFEFLKSENRVEIYCFFVKFCNNKELAYQKVLELKDYSLKDVKDLKEGEISLSSNKNDEISEDFVVLKNKDCLPKSLLKKRYSCFDNVNNEDFYVKEEEDGFLVIKYFETESEQLKNKLFIHEMMCFQMFLQNNSKFNVIN